MATAKRDTQTNNPNRANTRKRGRPRKGETRVRIPVTDNEMNSITFEDPDVGQRTKRPWHELYPNAASYVDKVLDAFLEHFAERDDGFAKKIGNLNVPLERDSEHPNNRAVRLLNDRCDARKLKCHAAIRQGNVHLVIGKRKVVKRVRKPKMEAVA